MKGTFNFLKRRIKSIKNTQQVTNAMKTVAVSKYNRSNAKMSEFMPYYNALSVLLSDIGTDGLYKGNDSAGVLYVVITANRGLCGTYNNDVIKKFEESAQSVDDFDVLMCGNWGCTNYKGIYADKITEKFEIPDIPEYDAAQKLSEHLCDLYQKGNYGKIVFITQNFKNILYQQPTEIVFLPYEQRDSADDDIFSFYPKKEELCDNVVKQALDATVYKVLINAAVGAHGAMLVAMRTSSDNSAEMLADLELQLNRMRQTAVTTEVIEVASGSNVKSFE